jgi:hypothetical protein
MAAVRRAYEEYLADSRWFTNLAPPEQYVFAARLSNAGAEIIDPGLFIGTVDGASLPMRLSNWPLGPTEIEHVQTARNILQQHLMENARTDLAQCAARLKDAAPARGFKAASEAFESISAALAVEQAGVRRGGDLGFDRARRRGNELAVLLARVGRDMRLQRLAEMQESLTKSPVTKIRFCILAVQ